MSSIKILSWINLRPSSRSLKYFPSLYFIVGVSWLHFVLLTLTIYLLQNTSINFLRLAHQNSKKFQKMPSVMTSWSASKIKKQRLQLTTWDGRAAASRAQEMVGRHRHAQVAPKTERLIAGHTSRCAPSYAPRLPTSREARRTIEPTQRMRSSDDLFADDAVETMFSLCSWT